MPRITPRLLRYAYASEPLLARLLPVCRTLVSAQNELRWLQEHVALLSSQQHAYYQLKLLVHRRAKGEPLQYILGTEYFGHLEIACRPGVLIPRQETAASVSHLARWLRHLLPQTTTKHTPLRVLDLCTGTGCIPLLFHHEFYAQDEHAKHSLDLVGIDISDRALALAQHNRERQLVGRRRSSKEGHAALKALQLIKADVLSTTHCNDRGIPSLDYILERHTPEQRKFQILISNPPYISHHDHKTVTAASVRRFEPKLALVPPARTANAMNLDEDQFYPRLWAIADLIKAQVILMEVGDLRQALRVADLGRSQHQWQRIEIWNDDPVAKSNVPHVDGKHGRYSLIGDGKARSVFAWRTPEIAIKDV